MPTDALSIDEALAGFREMMQRDGYELSWSLVGDQTVVVEVEAGPAACADCLSPEPVIEAIMKKALSPTDYRLDRVVLPVEH